MTNDNRARILVVEDEPIIRDYYERMSRKVVASPIEFVMAESLQQGFEGYEKNKGSLAGAILDRQLGDTETTSPLIKHMVADGFKGFMIATSSSRSLRQEMLAEGCTHEIENDKREALPILNNILAAFAPQSPVPDSKPSSGAASKPKSHTP